MKAEEKMSNNSPKQKPERGVFVFYTPCERAADEKKTMACENWSKGSGHNWCQGRGWHDSW